MAEEEKYQGEERRTMTESNLTVKWWCILLVFLGIFGFFFAANMNHESRLTRVETKYEAVAENMTEIKQDVKEIKTIILRQNKR